MAARFSACHPVVLALLSMPVALAGSPVPRISNDGPAVAFDFPAVKVGVAEYEEGPTGATVLLFERPVVGAVDVRGGAPGTVNTDALRLSYDAPAINAITLAGGSSYGLSVATGVANGIKDLTPDPGMWMNIAVVPGAIIFDLGGRRFNAVTPDEALGRAALSAARTGWVPLGARGGGRFAMQGGYFGDWQHSGQGAAFRQYGSVKVLVVTIVNALGSIVDRSGRVVRCSHSDAAPCELIGNRIASHLASLETHREPLAATAKGGPTANTTITVVVTNQAMPFSALQRLAVQVHNSMARAIQPFGTEFDGDTLFAVTTGDVQEHALSNADLGQIASETAWDAILASVPPVPDALTHPSGSPAGSALDAYVGRYEFSPGTVAAISRNGDHLEVELEGQQNQYLPAGKRVNLVSVGGDDFEASVTSRPLLRITRNSQGRIAGLTMNPGPWPLLANRLP